MNLYEIIKRGEEAKKSKDPITFYTRDVINSRNIKILMDPIDTLKSMSIKQNECNPYNQHLAQVFKEFSGKDEFNLDNNPTLNKKFIKQEELDLYMHNIEELITKAYINYYNNSKLPTRLYRSITKDELNFIKNNKRINTLWSTTKDFETCAGFTMEATETEWDPIEHYILQLSLNDRIPFIDVDKDSKTVYEPNEVILLRPFNVSNPLLIKSGGMDEYGFYSLKTIPICDATIKSITNNCEYIEFEEVIKLYDSVKKEFDKYSKVIEQILNYEIDHSIFNDTNYKEWANKIITMINMLQNHINYCILKDKDPKKLIKSL